MSDEETPPLQHLISELRALADEADEQVNERKSEVDRSEVDPSHMALAEKQGMRQAFQIAWKKAIEYRTEDHDE